MNIFDPLSIPLGKLMYFIYYTVTFENYGFALILFTILTRLAMLPLTIKQYKGTARMQQLTPKLDELKRQYGTDKKRLQEETMKLYQEEKVNPAGGCLPLLIQFPILFSLYPVITRPLRYMMGKTQEQITAIQELYASISGNANRMVQEMEILKFFKTNPSSMAQAEAANLLIPSDLINMKFLGLDLSIIPTYNPDILFGEQMAVYLPMLLIPLVGVVSTYISGRISMASSAAQAQQNQQASSMNKSMQIIGPAMTLIFSFQLPAGVLVYWIAGYLIQIVQQLYINKYVLKLGNIFTGKGAAADARALPGGHRTQTGDSRALPGGGGGGSGRSGGGVGGAGSSSGGSGSGIGNGGGGGTPRAGSVSNYANTQGGDGSDDGGFEGGSLFYRVSGALGGSGGGRVKSAGSEGVVHGGEFVPGARIPGVTTNDDFSEDYNGADAPGGSGDGGNAGDAKEYRDDSDYRYTRDYRTDGETRDVDGKNPQDAHRQARGTDARSNTQKNYGSQKHRKKK